VAAIFLVVVLAAMGGFMVSVSNSQKIMSTQDVQGTRAYWAARAGLEWALASIIASPAACPASPPATVDTGDVFNLAINCSLKTYSEGSNTVKIFSVQSVASKGTVGTIGFVERSVSASVEK
jgi:MSHA biogenesis protein MshP